MSTISLYIDIDVSEINDALGEEGARELAEYHDLLVVDLDDDADPVALEWAERHDFIRRPSRAELRERIEALLHPLVGLLLRAIEGDQEPSQ